MKHKLSLFALLLCFTASFAQAGEPIPADFNLDGAADCLDVDDLVNEILAGTNHPNYDLTGDGLVNPNDLQQWLSDAGVFNIGTPYQEGDANLDGAVDGVDFIIWNGNMNQSNVGWCGGDFNADGIANDADRALLCANAPPQVCDPVPTNLVNWGSLKRHLN